MLKSSKMELLTHRSTTCSMTRIDQTCKKGNPIMRKNMHRDAAKAKVEQAMDALAPGAAEQLAGKAKATIGQGQARLGEFTGHPEMTEAGHKLEVEGKVEEIVGRVKAATADAAERIKATGERISEKVKGQRKQS
jgi:uncharacterized protein YjbJ (UPF0337 family)